MVTPRFDTHPKSELMTFDFERNIRYARSLLLMRHGVGFHFSLCFMHISMVNFGLEFGELVRRFPGETQAEIKRRCLQFLLEAARQVRIMRGQFLRYVQ